MALTAEQKSALKEMKGVVGSYKTLGVGSARHLQWLAKKHFSEEIDISSAIAAVKSRRGDKIYFELGRLSAIIDGIEKKAR